MAIMNKIVIAVSALAAVASAAPLAGPLHRRAIVTAVVTETKWTTVDVTETVWVDINNQPVSTAPAQMFAEVTPSASAVVLSSTTSSITSTFIPTTTSTTTIVLSTSQTTTSTSLAVESSAAAVVAQVGSSARAVTASISATCEGEGDACVGDVTHWDGGLGACGWTVDTNADLAIALPYAFMGTESNSNPYCGRAVTLYNPTSGTTMQATVGDKCMGCVDRAIDTTDALFTAITDGLGDGRESGIQWWFT